VHNQVDKPPSSSEGSTRKVGWNEVLAPRLTEDLRARVDQDPELEESLKRDWQTAKEKERTASTWSSWRNDQLEEATGHWTLGCVFLRFLEDNHLLERPYLAGPGERLGLARDRHEAYFHAHPEQSDRDYLLACPPPGWDPLAPSVPEYVFAQTLSWQLPGPIFTTPARPSPADSPPRR
jgi:hypothetical protein